jgi:hypothetical protein
MFLLTAGPTSARRAFFEVPKISSSGTDVAPELNASERKLIQRAVSERDKTAAPVLNAKLSKPKKDVNYTRERLYGQFLVEDAVAEYESDSWFLIPP